MEMFVKTNLTSAKKPGKPLDGDIEDDDVWPVVESFFDEYGFLNHQLESTNDFYLFGIPKVVDDNRRIAINVDGTCYTVEFGEVTLQKPTHKELSEEVVSVYPKECIDRDITYLSYLHADIEFTTPRGSTNIYEHVHIGSIPVMVKSQLCNLYDISGDPAELTRLHEDLYDQGAYFIINGAVKVIASQQRTAYNKAYVFQNKKIQPKYEVYTEVRSNAPNGARSTTTQVGVLRKSSKIGVVIPYIEMVDIPVGVIFRALGATGEKDIIRYILPDATDQEARAMLVPSLEQSYECDTQEAALHYIGRRGKKFMGTRKVKKTVGIADDEIDEDEDNEDEEMDEERDKKIRIDAISYAKHLLSTEFLPHLGVGAESFTRKMFYLGYMVLKLLDTRLGRRKLEDRDHYANKRIATAGVLLSQLFYNAFKRLRSEITNSIERCIRGSNAVNILSIIKAGTIRTIMCNAISNNNWGGRGKTPGISQTYDKFNYAATVANARKLITPISAEGGKVEQPRHLHNSHWGSACPAETPEGKKCGLVTNLAMGCLITTGSSSSEVMELVKEMNIVTFEEVARSKGTLLKLVKVFINGNPIGVTKFPSNIVNELRILRRTGGLNPEVSISYDNLSREIHISTEAGRVYRPLFIVERGRLLLQKSHIEEIRGGKWGEGAGSIWIKLLERGFVELLDKAEETSPLIATYPSDLPKMDMPKRLRVTHCELHPCLIFGVGASLIPFPDHNQSPRNTYQSAMGKQAIGIPGTNYMFQTKGKFHVLNYPQKPLVSTRMSKIIGFDSLPAGQNAIVAVCPWNGFGQEDSIVMNQDSIERGFQLITTFFPFDGKVRRDKDEKFEVPIESECSNYKGTPEKLDPITGIISEGQKVVEGDILIGRTVCVDETLSVHRKKKQNISIMYDHPWPGTVHLVQYGVDGHGYDYVRVVVSQMREPEYGDKFSARHGQKGTMGMKYRSYDLPFTREGIAPDVLLNPLALPSRMTIGMLIEMICGRKVSSGSKLHTVSASKVFRLDDDKWDGPKDDIIDAAPKDKDEIYSGPSMPINDEYDKLLDGGDATPFQKSFSLKAICDELRSLGINEFCDEEMTNGQTGELMPCLIFTGVCYYQRLKHMVIDKVHARSRGGRTRLTRQPREGRKAGGGFRVGHMERDCFLAQGAPGFAKDRLMEQSDETRVWFCTICGLQALVTIGDPARRIPPRRECRVCESNKVVLVKMPYATKLLMQELAGMNIFIRVMPVSYGEKPGVVEITDGNKTIGIGAIVK